MNKELLGFFLIFIALFVGAFYYTNAIQAPVITSLNAVKSIYHNSVQFFEDAIYQHTFQARHIEELEKKLQKYEKNHLVMSQIAAELRDLYKENNSTLKTSPKVELVRSISYAKFGDFNRLWLEVKDYNDSKIYGLTYKELVAGIVIPQEGKPLALLNKDIKSAYAVYVGKQLAPGIVHGNNSQNLVVKFIPSWFDIQPGDEVITSGLDKVFFKGLKVGRVLSVTKSQGYQNAIVEPYYQENDPSFFHMIKATR